MLNKTLKSRLPLLLSLIAVLALGKQQVSQADAVVVVATGANAAAIQAKVDEFRNKLGKNNGVGGTFIDGRREVNWDGVPATLFRAIFLSCVRHVALNLKPPAPA